MRKTTVEASRTTKQKLTHECREEGLRQVGTGVNNTKGKGERRQGEADGSMRGRPLGVRVNVDRVHIDTRQMRRESVCTQVIRGGISGRRVSGKSESSRGRNGGGRGRGAHVLRQNGESQRIM